MWAHLAALSCGLLGTAWHCLVCLARPGFPTNSASTLPKRPLAQAVARVSCLGRQVWLVWSGHHCTVWTGIVVQSVCFCWPTLLEGRMQLLLFLLLSFLSFNNACSTVGGPAAEQVSAICPPLSSWSWPLTLLPESSWSWPSKLLLKSSKIRRVCCRSPLEANFGLAASTMKMPRAGTGAGIDWEKKEMGSQNFSKWKWPFPHSRFGHFQCPKRKSKTTS